MTRTARSTQVLTVLLVALTMGLEFAHVLELGPRLGYPPQLYAQLTNTLYFWFGTLGAAVYVGSIGAAAALTWLVRRCGRTVVTLTGAAAVLQLAALVTWLTLIALLELGVLVMLLVSFLTIPLALPHLVTGTVWMALTAAHVARRRRIYRALLRSDRHRRVAASTALIGCAVLVAVSGFVQWAGPDSISAAAIPWHAGSSMVLILLAVAHASRRLWRALRPRAAAHRHDHRSSMVDVP